MNAQSDFDIAAIDNPEAEQALLGAIMLHNDAVTVVRSMLKPEHFSEPLHQRAYAVIVEMVDKGDHATPITVRPFLGAKDDKIGDITLAQYLARLVSEGTGAYSVKGQAKAVLESWQRRMIVAECRDMIKRACEASPSDEPGSMAASLGDRIVDIVNAGVDAKKSRQYGDLLHAAMETVQARRNDDSGLIRWFLPEVNAVVGAVRPGNLVGLMSDSGGGKTSFSASQCRFAAEAGIPTAFFSIEVTEDEAALQMAAQRIGVSMGEIDEWDLRRGKMEALVDEQASGAHLPLVIEGFAEANIAEIRNRILILKKRMGLRFVMIDHAKMIDLPGRGNDLFAERVNKLYRELKSIAKATGVAIVILIQRNDDWKRRASPKPVPSDAYGGGSVKQNLDVFFSLYRPEPLFRDMYSVEGSSKGRDELADKIERCKGLAWIINHKRRRGEPMKSERVRFEAELTLFKSDAPDVDLPAELF
ncbi:replicative DNA helicase [Aureimonas psammosilenae]|uniref:replicative DNA helicase n=1 Tax=Aureimonas psammosilenae TaxID=2495496 RepID=UPI00186A42AB|nr:DnaB-like helicase C-terminal domain-containing protein [Aureimonas psammosilenae]